MSLTYSIVSIESHVQQSRLRIRPGHVAALALRAFQTKSIGRKPLVLCGEPAGGFRVIGQEEEDGNSRKKRRQAFEDE